MHSTIDNVLDRIRKMEDVEIGRGATDAEIRAAEEKLGVCFPEDYKRFLKEFGWVSIGSEEIYGLGTDVPSYLDVVKETYWEREESGLPVPKSLVPIRNDGAGNLDCLATHLLEGGRCPVVVWYHELGLDQELEKMAESFTDWLEELLYRFG